MFLDQIHFFSKILSFSMSFLDTGRLNSIIHKYLHRIRFFPISSLPCISSVTYISPGLVSFSCLHLSEGRGDFSWPPIPVACTWVVIFYNTFCFLIMQLKARKNGSKLDLDFLENLCIYVLALYEIKTFALHLKWFLCWIACCLERKTS